MIHSRGALRLAQIWMVLHYSMYHQTITSLLHCTYSISFFVSMFFGFFGRFNFVLQTTKMSDLVIQGNNQKQILKKNLPWTEYNYIYSGIICFDFCTHSIKLNYCTTWNVAHVTYSRSKCPRTNPNSSRETIGSFCHLSGWKSAAWQVQ